MRGDGVSVVGLERFRVITPCGVVDLLSTVNAAGVLQLALIFELPLDFAFQGAVGEVAHLVARCICQISGPL